MSKWLKECLIVFLVVMFGPAALVGLLVGFIATASVIGFKLAQEIVHYLIS